MKLQVRTIMMLTVMGLAAGCVGVPGIRADQMRDWTIILPADAIESEQYAAEELRTFDVFESHVGGRRGGGAAQTVRTGQRGRVVRDPVMA